MRLDKIPVSLLIDDSAPVNIMHWIHPEFPHKRIVPNRFTTRFADLCEEYGIRGKFTVLPMPAGLGRIDQSLATVSPTHLSGFLKIVKTRLARHFDITPELLTHAVSYNVAANTPRHLYEDEWVASTGLPELADYLSLALRILKNIGLPATGVTSPWATGMSNEVVYQSAIATAQWKINRRRTSWYFLHTRNGKYNAPTVVWRKNGRTLVTIPATTDDTFWPCMYARGAAARKRAITTAVDQLLSADGRQGQIVETVQAGHPVAILTHWQSLFSEGHETGLMAFKKLCARLRALLGNQLQWKRSSEMAEQCAKCNR